MAGVRSNVTASETAKYELDRKVIVGRNLKHLREQTGRSAEDIARIIAVTEQAIDNFEAGEGLVEAHHFFTLAKHFDVPVSRFFEDEAGRVVAP